MACEREIVPEVPSIEFTSFEIFDTTDALLGNNMKAGRLKFRFEAVDFGMNSPRFDPTNPELADTTNLRLTLYRKIGGVMQLVTDSNDPLLSDPAYRVPYLEKVGQSKVLRGEIIISMLYMSYNPNPTDTIKYDFFIIDRAGNVSNTEETAEIIVAENNVYKKE